MCNIHPESDSRSSLVFVASVNKATVFESELNWVDRYYVENEYEIELQLNTKFIKFI